MSVLIKGMEMPHDCDSCKVSDILDCTLWKPMDIGERHPECPLVEVPTPHGRLIDADRVIHEMNDMHVSGETFVTAVEYVKLITADASTVIEAEDE